MVYTNWMSNVKFYSFDEPFEDVVYPEGDSDAVSISKRDIDLLQPDTFVNDTIIDFYIKWVFIWYIYKYLCFQLILFRYIDVSNELNVPATLLSA